MKPAGGNHGNELPNAPTGHCGSNGKPASAERLLAHFDRIADAPDAVPRLRRFILDLAVRGKLVPQNPIDEPASGLLKRIAAEKARLFKVGAIRKSRILEGLTDDEKSFAVPKGWCWSRLGNIATYIQRGKSPVYADGTGFLVISQKCVKWEGLDLSLAREIEATSLEKYEEFRFLRDGDLLWNSTGTGTIGRTVRVESPFEKLVCDSHVTLIRCPHFVSGYLQTWLRSDHVYGVIEDRAAGSTKQVELTTGLATDWPVPVPPLAEQHRIVAKVDELMALCDRLEAARTECETTRNRLAAASLASLNAPDPDPAAFRKDTAFALDNFSPLTTRPNQIKALRQTILDLVVRGKLVQQDRTEGTGHDLLSELRSARNTSKTVRRIRMPKNGYEVGNDEKYLVLPLSWAWARLVDVGQTQTGTTPSSHDPELFGDFIPFIKPADLDGKEINYSGLGLSEKGVNNSRLVPENSVLMVCIGATLGKVNKTTRAVCFNQQINSLTPFVEDIADFVALALRASDFQELAWSKAGTGTLPIISKGRWEVLPIPLPPLAEQHRIVAKVDELMALCDRLEASLATGEETQGRLLESVLHEALEAGGQTAAY